MTQYISVVGKFGLKWSGSILLIRVLSLVTAGAFCCDLVLDPQLDSWTPSEVSLVASLT